MTSEELINEYQRAYVAAYRKPAIINYVDGWYVSPSWFESVEEDGMIRKIEALKKELVA